MLFLIELTRLKDRKKESINLNNIIRIKRIERGTMIIFIDNDHVVYKENYDEVIKSISKNI